MSVVTSKKPFLKDSDQLESTEEEDEYEEAPKRKRKKTQKVKEAEKKKAKKVKKCEKVKKTKAKKPKNTDIKKIGQDDRPSGTSGILNAAVNILMPFSKTRIIFIMCVDVLKTLVADPLRLAMNEE